MQPFEAVLGSKCFAGASLSLLFGSWGFMRQDRRQARKT